MRFIEDEKIDLKFGMKHSLKVTYHKRKTTFWSGQLVSRVNGPVHSDEKYILVYYNEKNGLVRSHKNYGPVPFDENNVPVH